MRSPILPRYTLAGDEYIFVQVGYDMDLSVNFQIQSTCKEITSRNIPGVIEAYPANTSYLVHYDPDKIEPELLLKELERIGVKSTELVSFDSRLIEIPILYNDPWSIECAKAFPSNHQDPSVTNLEFVARLNGMTVSKFIAAQTSLQYFVTMLRFLPGSQCCFPMMERSKALMCPTYVVPRQWTPERVLNMGGVFLGIVAHDMQPGGYQLLGRSPVPVYDRECSLPDLTDSVLIHPGDRIKLRSIERYEYEALRTDVESGEYQFKIVQQIFEPMKYFQDRETYLKLLEEGLRNV